MTDDQAWGLAILVLSISLLVPGRSPETTAGAAFGCLSLLLGAAGVLLGVALLTGTAATA